MNGLNLDCDPPGVTSISSLLDSHTMHLTTSREFASQKIWHKHIANMPTTLRTRLK